jgi:hypothetical protein
VSYNHVNYRLFSIYRQIICSIQIK